MPITQRALFKMMPITMTPHLQILFQQSYLAYERQDNDSRVQREREKSEMWKFKGKLLVCEDLRFINAHL